MILKVAQTFDGDKDRTLGGGGQNNGCGIVQCQLLEP